MSGPIVRSGASPAFSKNWDSIFGKQAKAAPATAAKADKAKSPKKKSAKKKAAKKAKK